MDEVTRLLSELVAIPSVNPMGRPLSGPGVYEAGMADYLERFFGTLGVRWERQAIAAGRDNVIARYDSPGSRTTLLFDAHQDTVPTDGMTIPPFLPRIEGGRLFGRGSCDVKGGMAAMLAAFARLVRERPPGAASLVMACTVDEEYTHLGSAHLAGTRHGANLAIVAEPTRLELVDCHKGAVRWKVRVKGVACHSSSPHLGINAIYRMAHVVSAMAGHADELARVEAHRVLGPPSLSVGRIEGGQSVNVVPDWCEIEVDRRLNPGEVGAAAMARARASLIGRLGEDVADWTEFSPPFVDLPALAPAAAAAGRWQERARDALTPVLGRPPAVSGVPFGTDAGPLGAAGLACLVFGPGDVAQAHTKDEWIELEQVQIAAEAYFALARALGQT
jgi:acetylornithine deacetylase